MKCVSSAKTNDLLNSKVIIKINLRLSSLISIIQWSWYLQTKNNYNLCFLYFWMLICMPTCFFFPKINLIRHRWLDECTLNGVQIQGNEQCKQVVPPTLKHNEIHTLVDQTDNTQYCLSRFATK